MTLQIVPMTEHHLDAALALTQHLRWPHRRQDWQQALALGTGLAAEEQGELVGTFLFWQWGTHIATVGLVIVADHAQGKGTGRQLMQAALKKLEGYTVRLHATEAGKPLYRKLGFVAHGEVNQQQTPSLPAITALPVQPGALLRQAQHADSREMIALDTAAHGQHRPALITLLLNDADCTVLTCQDAIVGFASVREFGHGYVVGPVIAHTNAQAKILISNCLSRLAGAFVRIDSPREAELTPWLNGLGLQTVDTTAVMVRGIPYSPGTSHIYALMSQAMG